MTALKRKNRVLIIGGGASGMIAALMAAREGAEASIFEKGEKLGKKLFITGKGRCNLTNLTEYPAFFENVVTNPKFLYSSLYGFTNEDTTALFQDLGLPLKVERGNRVFPVSDHAYDVIDVLKRELKRLGVQIYINQAVKEILTKAGGSIGVETIDGRRFYGDSVIIATGGLSYPSTGSTGDGYRLAEALGHSVKDTVPSLVPLNADGPYPKRLMGLSLKNIGFWITKGDKELFRDFGELLFTHFGISGPVVLTASAVLPKSIFEFGAGNDSFADGGKGDNPRNKASGNKKDGKPVYAHIDLKPALTHEKLDLRLIRDFEEHRGKNFKNSLNNLFPSKLIPVMVELSGIEPDKNCAEISRREREGFLGLIKDFSLKLSSRRGFEEAVITKGGVNVKEVDPATMESKLVRGLYFAGEVLDIDALTGGYNLQLAWSTGVAAGKAAGGREAV